MRNNLTTPDAFIPSPGFGFGFNFIARHDSLNSLIAPLNSPLESARSRRPPARHGSRDEVTRFHPLSRDPPLLPSAGLEDALSRPLACASMRDNGVQLQLVAVDGGRGFLHPRPRVTDGRTE